MNNENGITTNISETTEMNDTFIKEIGSRSVNNKDKYREIKPRKDKKEHPFLMFLLMLLFMGAGVGGTYYYLEIYNKNDKVNDTTDVELIEKLEEDGYLVNSLLNSLNVDYLSDIDVALQLYRDEKVTVTDLEENYVRRLVINEAMRENIPFNLNVTGEEFETAKYNLFADDIKLDNKSITDGCPSISYDEVSDVYKLDSKDCGNGTSTMEVKSTIVKSIRNKDKIEITKAIVFIDNSSEKLYKKYIKKTNADGEITYEVKDELENVIFSEFNIDIEKDNLNKYKYTFIYNNETDSYVFDSIEKVK